MLQSRQDTQNWKGHTTKHEDNFKLWNAQAIYSKNPRSTWVLLVLTIESMEFNFFDKWYLINKTHVMRF